MASIMIGDLCATETLERQASLRVKGGWYGGYLKRYPLYPSHVSKKVTDQFQSAQINNTAVGIGGANTFNLNGVIVQSQSA